MHTKEIFETLEKNALDWGRKYNRFEIGDVVETVLIGAKKTSLLKLSHIRVAIGRNKQKTCFKSLTLEYVGRRLYKDGSFKDEVGTGVWLRYFVRVSDGEAFSGEFNGVNQTSNDGGLSFCLACQPEAVRLYPQAHESYAKAKNYPYEF